MAAAGGGGGGGKVPGAGYTTIVAIDFGTKGTSYAVLYPDKRAGGDLMALAREVQTYSTDESSVVSSKAPTAVLLDPTDGNKLVAFGGPALKQFHDMSAEATPPLAVLYTEFKMVLRPGVSADPACLLVIGASTRRDGPPPAPVPVLLVIQRVLAAVAKAARARIVTHLGEKLAAEQPPFWVVTVPAIWDTAGKAHMRQAAVAAGLVPAVDAPNLLLALEPECALLAAIADAAPPVRESLNGKRVMILDCGGGTVDITFDEVASLVPLVLREVAPPQGGPWGASEVDRQVRKFLEMLLGVDTMAKVDASTLMNMMDKWEVDKGLVGAVDKETGGADAVTLRMGDIAEAADLTADDMNAMVQAFNRRAGYDILTIGPRKTLKLHGKVVRSFFGAVTKQIITCLQDTLKLHAEAHRVDYVLLVGGFGNSPYLLREVQDLLRVVGAIDVVRPARPGTAVVSGAALYALQPAAEARCVMPYTVGYMRLEEYAPALHPDCASVMMPGGRAMAQILVPMVQAGDRIGAHDHFTQTNLRPSSEEITTINIKLYRAPGLVLDPTKEPGGRRMVVLSGAAAATAAAARVPHVTDTALIGTLTVPVLDADAPFEERTMTLTVTFSETEAVAAVESRRGSRKVIKVALPPK